MAQEHNTRPHKRLVVLLVSVMAIGLALGLVTFAGAAALPSDSNVTVDRPDSQTVEFDANFSASPTSETLNVSLVQDGTTVESTQVSGNGSTVNGSLDTTGLQTGEFDVVAGSNPDAEIVETRMKTSISNALNATENETVLVDVGFDSDVSATSNVTITQGTSTNLTSLSFDPVEVADGTGTETAEYEAQTTGNVSVTVETTSAFAYDGSWVSVDDSGGGLFGAGGVIAGASNTQIYGFFALVVGLVVAYNRDLF